MDEQQEREQPDVDGRIVISAELYEYLLRHSKSPKVAPLRRRAGMDVDE